MLGRRVRRRSPRHLALFIAGGLIAAVLAAWGGSQAALALLDSTVGRLPQAQAFGADTLVYDRHGTLIADMHPPYDTRQPVPLSQVSPLVQQATIAVEDREFWHEGAADPLRLASAAWQDVLHGASQGASTITMQLAKVLYLQTNYSRTIGFKVRQLFMARHLETQMSKTQILESYLNDIAYGHGATGIEAAARVYFDTDAAHLDLAQSAMLAGLPNAPTELDPLRHPAAARVRQLEVLQAMVEVGMISRASAATAAAEPLRFGSGRADDVNRAPAFVNAVGAEVQHQLHLDPYRAGLRVVSTLDLGVQGKAEQTVASQVAAISSHNVTDGALVSIDPASGEVIAYVASAGPNVPGAQIDLAAHPRQPGSTFKLFTYATALGEKKVTMASPLDDTPLTLPTGGGPNGMQPYQVHNYDMKYHGTLPVAEALGNSLNIPAVKVELAAGTANVVHTARDMGVTTLDKADGSYGPSLTLGSYPVPLWEMAQAGAVFGAGGVLHPAHLMISAKDADGHELIRGAPPGRQVLDPGVAYIINAILTDDRNRQMEFGPHSALTLDGHLVAAKTGTTTDFKDNFTVGWTPRLVTATWVGNANNTAMLGTTGISGAAPMWHAFMSQALQNSSDGWPGPPGDVYPAAIGDRNGWFLNGTGPQAGDQGVHTDNGCRFWSVNNGNYFWCGGGPSGLPGDPLTQGGNGGAPPPPANGYPPPPPGQGQGQG
jgi:membrane peptidoglycan carboxypeptidase